MSNTKRFKKYEKGRSKRRITEALTRHKKQERSYNRRRILETLTALERATFEELKENTEVSRATLSSHLKDLMKSKCVKKVYDEERGRVVYRITEKALIEEVIVEGLVEYLGVVATHFVLRTKLGLPNPISIEEELENYLKDLGTSEIPPKKLFEALRKKYPLVI